VDVRVTGTAAVWAGSHRSALNATNERVIHQG
jgi:hypothetical protein